MIFVVAVLFVGALVGARAAAAAVRADDIAFARYDGEPDAVVGSAVAPAGDFNGDVISDVVVGAVLARKPCSGRFSAYVAFGRREGGAIRLRAPGAATGIRVRGCPAGAGMSVAGAGDVNGDGVGDVVIGVPGQRGRRGENAGAAYVVFGSRVGGDVDLRRLGGRGFRIHGARGDSGDGVADLAGSAVAGVGDVNGDGFDDVAVGTNRLVGLAEGGGIGSVYVVFGSRSRRSVRLAALRSRGFRVRGLHEDDGVGVVIAGVGDLDGDDRDDLIVGASGYDEQSGRGAAFVVFGSRLTRTVRLRRPGGRARLLLGGPGDFAGSAVAGVGDVNADGRPDLAIGAHRARPVARLAAGRGWVVFGDGTRDTIRLGALGSQGFEVSGAAHDLLGASVAAAGDVDGDGLDDVVFAAPGVEHGVALGHPGRVYVVRGRSTSRGIDVAAADGDVIAIEGTPPDAFAFGGTELMGSPRGQRAAGTIGDLDRDGRAELIVGAAGATFGGPASGSVYVLRP